MRSSLSVCPSKISKVLQITDVDAAVPTHCPSCQRSSVYCHIFFPNLPRFSLFFLNLPCCISFFFSFPCCGAPLLAMAFPPSIFLFLLLLGEDIVTNMFLQQPNTTAKDPGCHCTSWCWREPCSLLSSTPGPIPHHLHGSYIYKNKGNHYSKYCPGIFLYLEHYTQIITNAASPPALYLLFQVHFLYFLYILLVSLLKLLCCFILLEADSVLNIFPSNTS